jgi:crotonobetainyl-CoA:carnitine CoA-transferase CaiB-like acyl-CoA transferase
VPGPLEGVRVVELGMWVAGPAAGGVLADWGADVIKIEPPAGDPARTLAAMYGGDLDLNPPFEMDNRSKRGIMLDLRSEEGRATAAELADTADVFITNMRPEALERMGLDHSTLRARNTRLVYGLITGYGIEGPDAGRPAYDIAAFWARSGLAHLLSQPGEPPPGQRSGMGDHLTGMTLAGSVCAALVARERTGEGQLVATSMFRVGTYSISIDINTYLMWGLTIGNSKRERMGNPCINNYQAGDGRRFWVVGLEGERHWPPMCRVLGRTDWLDDPRYVDPRSRSMHSVELIAEMDTIFATKSLAEWAEVFAAEPDFFWAPINSVEDLAADEQFLTGGGVVYVPDEEGVETAMLATPVEFDGTPGAPRSMAPAIGQHTDEVLLELAAHRAKGSDSG